jgi:hypothetical protein
VCKSPSNPGSTSSANICSPLSAGHAGEDNEIFSIQEAVASDHVTDLKGSYDAMQRPSISSEVASNPCNYFSMTAFQGTVSF